MSVSVFMGLWISNSAGTAMMCPIVKAVINEMDAVSMSISKNKKGKLKYLSRDSRLHFNIKFRFILVLYQFGCSKRISVW